VLAIDTNITHCHEKPKQTPTFPSLVGCSFSVCSKLDHGVLNLVSQIMFLGTNQELVLAKQNNGRLLGSCLSSWSCLPCTIDLTMKKKTLNQATSQYYCL
jgi:hypothetical protein